MKLWHTPYYDNELKLKQLYIKICKNLPAYGCKLYQVKELLGANNKKKVGTCTNWTSLGYFRTSKTVCLEYLRFRLRLSVISRMAVQSILEKDKYFQFFYMSHFAYACKMRYPLNLVLENSEYLWFYWTFCIVILDYGLKLHKLSNHILVMLQKWLEIH